ncbi:hypothetical protein ACVDG5_024575 [Mesorhizobium sp. ORM6]
MNCQPGQPVIISPSLSDEQAKERFPQGWKELRPYRWQARQAGPGNS